MQRPRAGSQVRGGTCKGMQGTGRARREASATRASGRRRCPAGPPADPRRPSSLLTLRRVWLLMGVRPGRVEEKAACPQCCCPRGRASGHTQECESTLCLTRKRGHDQPADFAGGVTKLGVRATKRRGFKRLRCGTGARQRPWQRDQLRPCPGGASLPRLGKGLGV